MEEKRELIIGPDDCKESQYSINSFLEELSEVGDVTNRWGAPVDSYNFDGYIAITPKCPLKEAKDYVNRVLARFGVQNLKMEYFPEE